MNTNARYAQYDGHRWHTITASNYARGGTPHLASVAFWVIGADGYCQLVPGDAVDFTIAEYCMIAACEIQDELVNESYPLNPAQHAENAMGLTLADEGCNPEAYPGFRLIAGYSEWAPGPPTPTPTPTSSMPYDEADCWDGSHG